MERYEKELQKLVDELKSGEYIIDEVAKKLLYLKGITNLDPKGAIDVVFLSENYQINKSIKRLTWFIAILTIVNVIIVCYSLFSF